MSKNNKYLTIVIIIAAGLFVFFQSAFIVNEKEQVVVTQFGKPVGDAILEPGLKFKAPFIHKANFFDKRYLEWDGDPNQVPTKDKKFIFVDTYARWQIIDPLQFFKRLTNELGAQSRLDDVLDGETRDFIANHNLEEAVRSSNRKPESSGIISEIVADTLVDIDVGREKIEEMIQESANERVKDLGIAILDFRFKRINYVEEVREQVYNRMRSERYRIAEKFRSEGQGKASRINGEKENELKKIQSAAFRQAQEIKGSADGKAAAVYASAYNKTRMAKDLYQFTKTMETFESSIDENTSFILSTENDLFQYFKSMK